MWKTGESPRSGDVFCPHPTVETFISFHRACERNFCPDFFHRLSFHISQGLWRKFEAGKSGRKGRRKCWVNVHPDGKSLNLPQRGRGTAAAVEEGPRSIERCVVAASLAPLKGELSAKLTEGFRRHI